MDLKSCPFCGGDAHLVPRTVLGVEDWIIVCDDCNISVSIPGDDEIGATAEEIAEAWNTRIPDGYQTVLRKWYDEDAD